jgi:hypothetical protein
MRCIKANRTCTGYEPDASSAFRSYVAQGANQTPVPVSIARKCTLPARAPINGTDVLPHDGRPPEINCAVDKAYSVRSFIYDFCVVSPNRDLSRGFLSGVEPMFHRLGLDSNLAKACQIVSTGTHSKPLQRPSLTYMAQHVYQDLLGCLAGSIENPSSQNAAESKVVAMLLGIYQVIPNIAVVQFRDGNIL